MQSSRARAPSTITASHSKHKTPMKVIQGEGIHDVKVTFMKKVGYLISIFTNGTENQKSKVKDRIDIGPEIRSMLRMEDKVGNISKMAKRSRHRHWEKLTKYENTERAS